MGKTLFRVEKIRLIDLLIPRILNAQNAKEWMDYFDCLASGFELIRSSYLEELKIFKNPDAIWEDMKEYYNYEEAKKEAQLAYEESCDIDNQSYELECLENKIIIFKLCGVSDNELLENNQRMEMLIEAVGENTGSRYYLPK